MMQKCLWWRRRFWVFSILLNTKNRNMPRTKLFFQIRKMVFYRFFFFVKLENTLEIRKHILPYSNKLSWGVCRSLKPWNDSSGSWKPWISYNTLPMTLKILIFVYDFHEDPEICHSVTLPKVPFLPVNHQSINHQLPLNGDPKTYS